MTTGCKSADAQATTRRQRMVTSPQGRDGRFVNALPRHDGPMMTMAPEFFFGGSDHRRPVEPLPLELPDSNELETPPQGGLRVTWLGHSTSLVELDGARLLLDPMFAERASPFSWTGPERFHRPPVALESLPRLDALLLSHDHYDHLEQSSVEALAQRAGLGFVVPLGVGTRLERWGIDAARVTELDWWEELRVGAVRVVLTPARHFSGRSAVMSDQDETPWGSWAVVGSDHRVYYSGDSAMFPGFEEIGERLGPFDVTLIEWPTVPRETVEQAPVWSSGVPNPTEAAPAPAGAPPATEYPRGGRGELLSPLAPLQRR